MSVKYKAMIVAASLVIIAAMVFFWTAGRGNVPLTKAQAAEIAMTATLTDSTGVALSSNFVIQAPGYIDPQVAAKELTVEPGIPVQVKAGKKSGELMVVPLAPLQPDQIYSFSLSLPEAPQLKWAFQTRGQFRVNGSLPRDETTGVPVNTGIEIDFSHQDFAKVDDYFEISPQVKGRFEIHKKTISFVPESLEPATIYTVTIKKGLKLNNSDQSLLEDYRFSFETGDLPQENPSDSQMDVIDQTMEFTTSEVPIVPLSYYNSQSGSDLPEADVVVYRYPSAADYIAQLQAREDIPVWAYSSRRSYLEDPAKLTKVTAFAAALKKSQYDTLLQFPAALPNGFYLAQITVQKNQRQLWFQVTDLGIYALQDEKIAQVWLHHLKDGSPAEAARVSLAGSSTFSLTDQSGLAQLAYQPEEGHDLYLLAQSDGQETVLPLLPQTYGPLTMDKVDQADLFWKYLYLDRGLYRPDDTLNYWGLLKARQADGPAPAEITLAVTKWEDWQAVDVLEQPVVMAGSSFTGGIRLPNLLPGNYSLELRQQGQLMTSQWFAVADYAKPAYRVTAAPGSKAMLAGGTVQFAVDARCFEDTPVPGLLLHYSLDQEGSLRTDAQGAAKLDYTPKYQRQEGSPVNYHYLYLNAQLPEVGEISAETSVIVLNTDIEIKGSGQIVDGQGHLDLQINRLTVDKVNSGQSDPWLEDAFFLGSGGRQEIQLAVYRQDWDKIPDGDYYNFITKQVEKRYRYEEKRVQVALEVIQSGSSGKARYSFPAEAKKSYWVEATAKDSQENAAVCLTYLPGEEQPQQGEDWYYLTSQQAGDQYQVGDEAVLQMKNQDKAVADRPGSFLFLQSSQGLQGKFLQDNGRFTTVFKDENIPNTWIRGVYFDGRYYHETPDYLLAFNPQSKALKIKVTLDKKEYKPGDTVRASVSVRDQRGRPVQTELNMNLVDEALFALQDQQVDFLQNLYGDYLGNGVISSGSSHLPPIQIGGGAEQGGEGGALRENFQDAAFFKTVTTAKNGYASFSFQVPDNLTSWRLTYHGLSEDLQAGSGAEQIKVRLPFFADLVASRSYLTGDQPTIYLRALGTELDADSLVYYTVRLEGLPEKFEKNFQGKAFLTMPVVLPQLPAGSFKLKVFVRSAKGSQDALALSMKVADTYLVQDKVDDLLLSNQTKIKGAADAPTTMIFSDYQRSQYLTILQSMAGVTGMRLEEKIAGRLAGELLKTYFPDQTGPAGDEAFSPLSYQTESGGLAALPYGSADLGLSAKAAALLPDLFDSHALAGYFYHILNDPLENRERVIVALWGLASLHQPVLGDIALLEKAGDLSVKEQLLLILANQSIGNRQPAAKTLAALLKKSGQAEGGFLRLDTGRDSDDVVEVTALAAMAAAMADSPSGHPLQEYVVANEPLEILAYPEQLIYLRENLPRLDDQPVSFSYDLAGSKHDVELAAGKSFKLICPADQLASLSFSAVQGKVGVSVKYQAALDQLPSAGVDGTTLSRSYTVSGKAVTAFSAGDLVMVKIAYQMGAKSPKGLYQIADYLPAGLKIIEKTFRPDLVQENLGWPVEIAGQRAVFLVSQRSGSFHYYARVINAGRFTAENSIIQATSTGRVYALSPQVSVVIK